MDKGPWRVCKPVPGQKWAVLSDDFKHDVMIYLTGDFADDDQRRRYCEWLVGVLNVAARRIRDAQKASR